MWEAFVLAPWTGTPVAIQPPSIAVKMGLVSQGEMWLVRQAIYGLRESPAVWSEFRDKELMEARWTMKVKGEDVDYNNW